VAFAVIYFLSWSFDLEHSLIQFIDYFHLCRSTKDNNLSYVLFVPVISCLLERTREASKKRMRAKRASMRAERPQKATTAGSVLKDSCLAEGGNPKVMSLQHDKDLEGRRF
jgi:hypothetical protein